MISSSVKGGWAMENLSVGSRITLDIRKQGINGEGIGYFNKLTVFVHGAILKETVLCEVVELHQTYAMAKIIEIIRESTRRVVPLCKFYDRCGGCQMQHIHYREQLKIKQSIIHQALSRYTELNRQEIDVMRTIGMDDTYRYRNKAQMPLKNTNFGLALGLYAPGSNQFVYVDTCIVQDEAVNLINKETLSLFRKHDLLANDSSNPEGILLNLVTRYLASTHTASVTFVVTEFDERLKTIAKELLAKNTVIRSVSYSINRKKNPQVMGDHVTFLGGEKQIYEHFEGMDIGISPDAFHQLNSRQMRILYSEMLKAARLTGTELVVDAYSGIGITSLILAKSAKHVYGIDYSSASIKDAIDNQHKNHIKNVTFIEHHVERGLPELFKKGIIPDVLIVDPPRAGLQESLIKAILAVRIPKLVYVSCNPSTLAKNLNLLFKSYRLEYIQPIDMFPHTASVESVTLLTLKSTYKTPEPERK